MTTDETTALREHADRSLRAFGIRDTVATAGAYVEDGVFIDSQYPEVEYQGSEMIREAFERTFTNTVVQLNLTVRKGAEENSRAVEVTTHNVANDGPEREFLQVFVVEGSGRVSRAGRRISSFSPDSSRQTARETARES